MRGLLEHKSCYTRAMNQLTLRVEEGRVLLPAQIRDKLGLHEGDELLLTLEGHRLILESEAALLEHLYQAVGTAKSSALASEELIQERREEAVRE
jgi:AbrB family looped-hinge helix DNA binding protein